MSAKRTPTPPDPPRSWWRRLSQDPRLGTAAWALLPLRAFLAVTFLYAGLSKLFDRHYLDAASPLGVRSQMLHAAAGSPISGLVNFSAHHATLIGLMIAFGEVAAGLGVLVGLFARLAATIGLLLALSFYLTVSWHTTPYYFGADIVFVFAWTPLLIAGDGGLFSVRTAIRRRVRERMRLPAVPGPRESATIGAQVGRRTTFGTGVLAGVLGAVLVFGGGALALLRRRSGTSAAPPANTTPPATGQGQTIAQVSEIAVGSAKSFTTANRDPAWLLHPTEATFTAFSAVCTHQGCPVQWVDHKFQCPCHGATYDSNGKVTGGPAPAPLSSIAVSVVDGQVRTA